MGTTFKILLILGAAIAIAIAGGVAAVASWFGLCCLLNLACRSRAERIAIRQFKQDYPDEHFGYSHTVKECRDVVMVAYGQMTPPTRKYYRVSVASEKAIEVLDDAMYRPQRDR